jgi:DUF1365 family protein
MHSALYEGTVTHRRREPVMHQFQYRLAMVYLDLSELAALVGRRRLIPERQPAAYAFQREDYLFDADQPLEDEIRTIVQQRTGSRATGPIRMLTQLRWFGYYFSPLNLFYVFDEGGKCVEFVLAEVNNTPWKERHCYVLWQGHGRPASTELEFSHPKEFHVSPFMDMDFVYRWRLSQPAERLSVGLTNYQRGNPIFGARMTLTRRPLSREELRRMTWRYPFLTGGIVAAIYYQAWKLWCKKCPYYPHPQKRAGVVGTLTHKKLPTT